MRKQPTSNTMYKALIERNSKYEGIFFVGVKTTGIFCRPSCSARKPKRQNVEFYFSTREAILHGYRPCKICRPLQPKDIAPDWLSALMKEVDAQNTLRISDQGIRRLGIDPNRVRRWFKKNHKMTFQTYLRSRRLGQVFGHLTRGGKVIDTAYESGYESLSGFTGAVKKLTKKSPSQLRGEKPIHVYKILSPLGPMLVGATETAICLLEFIDRKALETEIQDLQKRMKARALLSKLPIIDELEKQLNEYFNGARKEFSLPLETPGTDFQNRVWRVLQEIPYGTTRSYKEQAIAVGNAKAVRAVARANGQNRIAIIIPCHRIIGASGELVGYAGGIWRKKFLLELEQKKQP